MRKRLKVGWLAAGTVLGLLTALIMRLGGEGWADSLVIWAAFTIIGGRIGLGPA